MIEVRLLHELAADLISPRKSEKVRRLLQARASGLHRCLIGITIVLSTVGALGLLAIAAGFVAIIDSSSNSSEWIAQSYVAGGTAAFMASWFGSRLIQRRKRYFVKKPYDIKLPKKIERLFADLASGKLRAMVLADYGSVSTNALHSTNGLRFETELAPGTFANRFAPILLLSDSKKYSSLWMPRGQTLHRPIYVVQDTAEEPEATPQKTAGVPPEQEEAMQSPSSTVPTVAGVILSKSIQPIAESATLDTISQAPPETAQQQEKTTSAVAIEHTNTIPATTAPAVCNATTHMARSDSSARTRDESIKLVAASLDEAKISKRDVKSHHIAERWNKNDGPQPDVGSVRTLMKGQQAGAPARSKIDAPARPN